MLIILWTLFALSSAQFLNGNSSDQTPDLYKCCSLSESLIRKTYEEITVYECVDSEFVVQNYSIPTSPLMFSDALTVGHPDDIQSCSDIQVLAYRNNVLKALSSQCYDRLVLDINNGTLKTLPQEIIALKCITNELETPKKLNVSKLRKCCPDGQRYDSANHICRSYGSESTAASLALRIHSDSDVLDFHYGLDCKYQQYAVQMSDEFFEFRFRNSDVIAQKIGTKGPPRTFNVGEWCVDHTYDHDGLVVRGCTEDFEDCRSMGAFCIRKCCPVGQHYQPRRCNSKVSDCVPNTDDLPYNISSYLDDVRDEVSVDMLGIAHNLLCTQGKFVMDRKVPSDYHHLMKTGEMNIPTPLMKVTNEYCLETFDYRNCGVDVQVYGVACYRELITPYVKNFSISVVTLSISCVFLLVTLCVYLCLPELRNLHGKTLICHLSTMLFAFCSLARVQYDRIQNQTLCMFLGYGIYFGFIAAFAWLNVMCFDIWWTFGSMRTVQPMKKASVERRRFIWYSVYAWTLSITMTVVMLLFSLYPVSSVLDSKIGDNVCFFGLEDNTGIKLQWAHIIYFLMPVGLLVMTNFILFVLTVRHCNQVKSEVHRLQAGSTGDRAKKRFKADKARLMLTMKLWVVMGAGWVWELVTSFVVDPQWLWATFDTINELQGVTIFVILVLKPKIYHIIKKKLGLEKADQIKNGTSSGARTSSTFLSRSISNDEKVRVSLTADKTKL